MTTVGREIMRGMKNAYFEQSCCILCCSYEQNNYHFLINDIYEIVKLIKKNKNCTCYPNICLGIYRWN